MVYEGIDSQLEFEFLNDSLAVSDGDDAIDSFEFLIDLVEEHEPVWWLGEIDEDLKEFDFLIEVLKDFVAHSAEQHDELVSQFHDEILKEFEFLNDSLAVSDCSFEFLIDSTEEHDELVWQLDKVDEFDFLIVESSAVSDGYELMMT
ncbi:hypothetical protein K1719_001744 [Acacia pycnantha]|nr:hypothetical protein K1719_001744 [Acacia pycnantha]